MKSKHNQWLPAVLCCALLLWCLWLNFSINQEYFVSYFLDADGAAEIRLAEIMHENNEWIFSSNWYYSTELRFLHNQLVMRPLFLVLNTPLGVHLAATLIIGIIMAASALFCFKAMRLPLWQAFLAAAIVITPFSREVFSINLAHCYYSFFIAGIFVFLGLYNLFLRANKRIPKLVLFAGMLVLGVLEGMCGIRPFILLFAPGLLVSGLVALVETEKNLLQLGASKAIKASIAPLKKLAIWIAASGAFGVGYVIYDKILLTKYPVGNLSGKLILSSSSDVAGKLRQIPSIILTVINTPYSYAVLSGWGIINLLQLVLCLILFSLAVYVWFKRKRYSEAQQFYIHFAWASFFISIIATVLTANYHVAGETFVPRYIIPGTVLIATLPLMLLADKVLPFTKRYASLALCAALLVVNPLVLQNSCGQWPQTNYNYYYDIPELQDEVSQLVADGYKAGYASFKYAGSANVLSNSALDVVGVYPDSESFSYRTWLEPKDHDRIDEMGPYFLMLDNGEYNDCYELLQDLEILFQSQHRIVLRLDDASLLFPSEE